MMDKCNEIRITFNNEVLGPYDWTWKGDDAEAVFDALRPLLRAGVAGPWPTPTIRDLREPEVKP